MFLAGPIARAAAFGLAGLCACAQALAQCGTPINTFPYNEGFEGGPAWTSGGTGNDWAWGTPGHPLINAAGGGTKSWCVGGLTGAGYTFDERSFLESPCFDFTALDAPRISFKVFWETERNYDGLTFQYSTDDGATYSVVGAFNEPTNCLTAYWFNTSDVTNLAPQAAGPGWSGRVGSSSGNCAGGNGSQTWVTAKHCLGWLAHEPSVRFRFFFGAGSQCNGYDGIAVDDILITDGDPVAPVFDFTCNSLSVDFTNYTTCASTYAWDFGDPASGALNVSPQPDPTHVYPGAGTYTVHFTATDACGSTATVQQDIKILGVSIAAQDPTCGQPNGSATATVTGTTDPVNYAWSPGGGTTATITGLDAGSYTVTVTATGACAASASTTLDPSAVTLDVLAQSVDVTCAGAADGSAQVHATGGVEPYTYAWTGGAGTDAIATDLGPGIYICTVSDDGGCSADVSVAIGEPDALTVDAGPGATLCTGGTVTLAPQAAGGTPAYDYTWSPEGPVVTPTATTTYSVTATDANGCISPPADVTITVSSVSAPSFTSTDVQGCAPHCITFAALPAGLASYTWDFGDAATGTGIGPQHCYGAGGLYTVSLTIADADGCTASITTPDYADVRSAPDPSFIPRPPFVTSDAPTFQFVNTTVEGELWVWHFGDADSSLSLDRSPVFAYDQVGCYTVRLVATNSEGCSADATGEVCMEDPYALYAPNTFTPDNDDINDVFRVITSVMHPDEFSLEVFDRWDKVVFRTDDLYQAWNGDGIAPGVYTWKVHLKDRQGKAHDHLGHITLLR